MGGRRMSGSVRRAGRAVARAAGRAGGAVRGVIRRLTHAQGAGESGLGRLIEMHAVNQAGDMLVTVALASTVFFSVPTGQARGRVALYLLVTMAPFAVLAPVLGPVLDRVPHGRRVAMAVSMVARAVLAWAMASVVSAAGIGLYPAALGVLVAAKAMGVVRSAAVPRLLPPRISLVRANSRITLSGLLAGAVATPTGALLHLAGPAWPLYAAFGVYSAGAFLCLSLPPRVDSPAGETTGADPPSGAGVTRTAGWPWPPGGRRGVGPLAAGGAVLPALRANCALKALTGLLTLFLAFVLREHPLDGLGAAFSLGLLAVAAGGGNALGNVLGAWLRARTPERIVTVVLASALAVTALAAAGYGAVTVTLAATVAGLTQAMGKLALDALIQRDVPEAVRTSAFARSETALQLAWVFGGALGIVLPLNGTVGLAVGAALVALGAVVSLPGLLTAGRRAA
ncbi:integral membrane protein [Streptantibioticus cattleyicolor NRRL 8057 = DSM 46488]|uniref:Integral membrane protein n=1 Tax=Streptantibioticus cattleyicolor (strain ATCC 35852 / DSM 46488 / JCM 4925 / NBRC 14057 / NRRL 8057) TaxID=1003195 RepID=F8K002_STREN|nr:integral membrane protein [Streptantibioticus cattleyicolor NRRL 8057 = DSM 46488]MYS59401.1 MFS transporter [Streptomyces sp. SID5468]CCB75132.1 putative integral membrane protein [Streptantibioticus cattleyicolor NRRL 8057 = DSM 46488]